MTTTTTITTITITITSDILAQIFCGIAGMADNEFAARKSEGAGAVEDERWRRWMQTMKKKIISKNIVCETCNAVCQHVCYHKTNFSATDINPDCRLSNIFCSVACADMYCSKMECSVLHPCEKCSKMNLEEEARAAAREFDEHGERSIG